METMENYVETAMEMTEVANDLINETVEALPDVVESVTETAPEFIEVTTTVVEDVAKDPSIWEALLEAGKTSLTVVGGGVVVYGGCKLAVKGAKKAYAWGKNLWDDHKAKKAAKDSKRVEVLVEDADTDVKPVDPAKVSVEEKKTKK